MVTEWELQERLDVQRELNLALMEENDKHKQHIETLYTAKFKVKAVYQKNSCEGGEGSVISLQITDVHSTPQGLVIEVL